MLVSNYIYQKMTFSEINQTLQDCSICVLALSTNNEPYMLPMYFEYDTNHNEPLFVLESKNNGQKIHYLNSNNQVCIFVQYNEPESYKSIVASGKAYTSSADVNCSYQNIIKIKVQVQEITGRIYHK